MLIMAPRIAISDVVVANLWPRSESLSEWGFVGLSGTADTTLAPDGNTTADTMTVLAAQNTAFFREDTGFTFAAAGYYWISVHALAGTHDWVAFWDNNAFSGATFGPNYFDLTNEVAGAINAVASEVVPAANGFIRYGIKVLIDSGDLVGDIRVFLPEKDNDISWGGSSAGTETIIVWGSAIQETTLGGAMPAYQPNI